MQSEIVIAYLESFLATSWLKIVPVTPKIRININQASTEKEIFSITQNENLPEFELTISKDSFSSDNWVSSMSNLCAHILSFFTGEDLRSYLENLFKEEEIHQRTSLLREHLAFVNSVMGNNPKILLDDWNFNGMIQYKLKQNWNDRIILSKNFNDFIHDKKTVKHGDIKVDSVIDTPLWDKAEWTGFAVVTDSEESFCAITLAFKNNDAGDKIFETWQQTIGKIDYNNKIKIAIIQGINKENPYWYRVLIYSIPDKDNIKDGQYFITASRMHTMTPDNPTNLNHLKRLLKKMHKFWLCPMEIDISTMKYGRPHFDYAVGKAQIEFLDAYEIGRKSIHAAAILDTDEPIIPKDVQNAPILELLRKK